MNYCIQVDQAEVSASIDEIRDSVKGAIDYWKYQFTRPIPLASSLDPNGADWLRENFNSIGVGRQEFVEVPCSGQEDLRIQFGLSTLSQEQLRHIPNPKSYVGITERTSYDPTQLKGKGFIFIASDMGPTRYNGDALSPEKVWSNPVCRGFVLLHELGHVFGIPHVGQELSLMSEQLPEAIVSQWLFPFEARIRAFDIRKVKGFFFADDQYSMCLQSGVDRSEVGFLDFFGAPQGDTCIAFTYDDSSKSIRVESKPAEGAFHLLGAISGAKYNFDTELVIQVRLSPEQSVFPPDVGRIHAGGNELPFLVGPFKVDFDGYGGSFFPAQGGDSKPVIVHVDPDHFTVSAIVNGALQLIFSSSGDLINFTGS